MAMTPVEFQRKLEAKIADLNTAKLLFPVAQEVQRRLIKRLFDEGEGAQGKLGTYSTTPHYFTKKQFKKTGAFKAKGKNAIMVTRTKKSFQFNWDTGSSGTITKTQVTKLAPGSGRFQNGNPRQSMFLAQGYKELKAIQGYESSFVNLQYSKDLRNDISTGMQIKGDKVISKVKRGINADKAEWLSDKYGEKTFKHTEEEKNFFNTEVTAARAAYFNS
jgi:hypothetical protein